MSRMLRALKEIDSRVHTTAPPTPVEPTPTKVQPESEIATPERDIDSEIDSLSQQLSSEVNHESHNPFVVEPNAIPVANEVLIAPPKVDEVIAPPPQPEPAQGPEPHPEPVQPQELPPIQWSPPMLPEPVFESIPTQAADTTKTQKLEDAEQISSEEKLANLANLLKFNPHMDAVSEPSKFEKEVTDNLSTPTLSKQYQQLANAIVSNNSPDVPVSMMCISSSSSDKTADTIAHVAASISKKDMGRVLVVDCDLASKTLSKRFDRAKDTGLVESLLDQVDWRKSIGSLSFKNVDFVSAGVAKAKSPANLAAPLGSFLHQAKQDYQFVLVDAGHHDKQLENWLGRYCDMTYVLIELGQTDIEDARRMIDWLRSSGSRIVGSIATGQLPHAA